MSVNMDEHVLAIPRCTLYSTALQTTHHTIKNNLVDTAPRSTGALPRLLTAHPLPSDLLFYARVPPCKNTKRIELNLQHYAML